VYGAKQTACRTRQVRQCQNIILTLPLIRCIDLPAISRDIGFKRVPQGNSKATVLLSRSGRAIVVDQVGTYHYIALEDRGAWRKEGQIKNQPKEKLTCINGKPIGIIISLHWISDVT
jgi:hypothetical protein